MAGFRIGGAPYCVVYQTHRSAIMIRAKLLGITEYTPVTGLIEPIFGNFLKEPIPAQLSHSKIAQPG
jgi:hypothetical protein